MKRIDRLIIGEMAGPWAFGVAIFTVLIMAGSFLFEITRYLAEGVSPLTALQLVVLLLPGILAKTFSMAVLLAALLSFGRLSGDSEIVALKANGVSVARMMVPVAGFGTAVFLLAFLFNETVVPPATLQATQVRLQIEQAQRGRSDQPTWHAIHEGGRLSAMLMAKDFDIVGRTLRGAVIVTLDKQQVPTFVLYANELVYEGPEQWRIRNGARLVPMDGGAVVDIQGDAFPPESATPKVTIEDLVAKIMTDLDALSMRQMGEQVERERANPAASPEKIANKEFGYWNKIAIPLAALVFGLVGAPLGIRNHRAGASTGFWMSVVIIFAYLMLANMMSIYAQGGLVPPYVASFAPIVVGVAVGGWLIHSRNK